MKTQLLGQYLDENNSPGLKALTKIVITAVAMKATDLYIRDGAPLVFRAGGERQYAIDWAVGEKGILPTATFDEILTALSTQHGEIAMTGDHTRSFTKVFLVGSKTANPGDIRTQVRIHYSAYCTPRQLLIRLLPVSPFPIDSFLGTFAETKKYLSRASGLVLVAGPIGAGKTSLMSSIVEYWASGNLAGKSADQGAKSTPHIWMVGDPVEYYLPPEKYIVTSTNCSMTEGGKRPDYPSLHDVIPDVLRGSVDALSVGEIRDASTFNECLEFAAAREPLISTIHAASIAECVVRAIGMAEKNLSPDTARLMLSNCLEGIFYVNIAYQKESAVPIVEFLSTQSTAVRTAIARGSANDLVKLIEDQQRQASKNPADITRPRAIEAARKYGLTEVDVSRTLGRLSST